MANLTEDDLLRTVECFLKHECQVRPAAAELGIGRNTFRNRLRHARKQGLLPEQKTEQFDISDKCRLEAQVIELKKELKSARRHQMSTSEIKRFIHEIKDSEMEQPNWVIDSGGGGQIGTPCLLVSDAHWYERVDAEQIGGANEYSAETARARLRTLCERTVDLLTNHIARPGYPGIVCAFAGDMLSGNIHEELKVTNEGTLLQAILDLYGHAIEFIRHLADAFGRVFVPCVAGNHSRLTQRIQAKNFAYENVDWHLYCLLEKHFEKDDRIRFLVSDSEDVQFRIHGWVYRMTHGSQFKGGDGIIGALGPITRGDIKKRAQATNLGEGYDTLLLGHFHRLMQLRSVIVNGSIKGFDEYAKRENFPWEPPQQALWITHPERGITLQMPVHLDRNTGGCRSSDWVSWQDGAKVNG